MHMKSLLTAAALMAAVAIYAQPQGGRGGDMTPEQRAEMMAKRMKTELNLTDEQTEAIKQFNLTNMPKQGERPDEDARKKMQEQREAEMKKILTEEQFAKWQEMQKNRMQGRSGMQSRGMSGRSGEARPEMVNNAESRMDRLKEELSLTDSQVEQLKAIREGDAAERKQEMDRMMDLRKEKSAAYEEKLQNILTPEQYTKLQELRKQQKDKNTQASSLEKKKK